MTSEYRLRDIPEFRAVKNVRDRDAFLANIPV